MTRQYDVQNMSELSDQDRRDLEAGWYDDWFAGVPVDTIARECSVAPSVVSRVFMARYEHERATP